MAIPIIMPRQGQSVESCILGKWFKDIGDKVELGDLLFSYETDKAAFEETSKADGIMLARFFEAGDDVPCLLNVCVIGSTGESFDQFKPVIPGSNDVKPEISTAAKSIAMQVLMPDSRIADKADISTFSHVDTERAVSPRARVLADKTGADIRFASGSGPNGRVIERDILQVISDGHMTTGAVRDGYPADLKGSGIGGRITAADVESYVPAEPDFYEEKHSNIRKLIAKSMFESLSTMAQLTLDISFDATDIISLRNSIKVANDADASGIAGAIIPSFNDLILFAVSRVLRNHKPCNAHYYPDRMLYFNNVNLGVAVDTPRGLMVPTIAGADSMSISQISSSVRELAAECQKGTISPDFLKGATFTVTNLGAFGIESFTPVINPPQTCILGVNALYTSVKDIGGAAVPYQAMRLSLTFDHRALDGAPAARFLKDLKDKLEHFTDELYLK